MKSLFTAILLLTASLSFAQDEIKMPELDTENKVYVLEFSPDTQDERVISAYMQGTTERDSLRFWAAGTNLTQKVMVTVLAKDKKSNIKVDIVKHHWTDSKISGNTRKGYFQESFDTANKFGIVITSDTPGQTFYLAVWTSGEIIPANMNNLYIPVSGSPQNATLVGSPAQMSESLAKGNNTLLYVIIGLLILIAIVLLLLAFKKKKGNTASIIIFLFLGQQVVLAGAFNMGSADFGNLGVSYPKASDLFKFANDAGKWSQQAGNYLDLPADADSEPRMNPPGAPRLPSSCLPPRFGTTTSTRSLGGSNIGTSNSGTNDGAKAPTADNSGTEVTASNDLEGASANEPTLSEEDAREYANEKSFLRQDRDDRQTKARNELEESQKAVQQTYNTVTQQAQEVYNGQMESAKDNPELQTTLTSAYSRQMASLSNNHVSSIQRIQSRFEEQMQSSNMDYELRLQKLADEYAARGNDDSSDSEKDSEGEEKKIGDEDKAKGGPGTNESNNSGAGGTSRNNANSEGCECLDKAYIDLNKRRLNLERLRIIYQHAMKKIKAGIAFGDNVSGVHGVSGLAWQSQKMIILKESIPTLNKAYDDKYAEMIEALEENLRVIEHCEALLGYENWYNHAGFIYFQFMADKYKRD